jgi:hypothetical protein
MHFDPATAADLHKVLSRHGHCRKAPPPWSAARS